MSLELLFTVVGMILTLGALGGLVVIGGRDLRSRSVRRGRLAAIGGVDLAERPSLAVDGRLAGLVKRLGQQSAVRDPAQVSALRLRLMQAGFYHREAPAVFLGVKAIGLLIATLGVVAILPLMISHKGGTLGAISLAASLSVAALYGPDMILKRRKSEREREYSDGFPDLLDLLVASVEAGLSLDAGVTRVTEELERRYPNLTIHLRFLVLELRAGRARKDAWTAFADRLGIDDARALATMLRQAEDMGTSLGETLSVFSADMRTKRMLRAEEKALGLSAKLTVPLILFIFPAILGALMLPAAARLMDVFGKP